MSGFKSTKSQIVWLDRYGRVALLVFLVFSLVKFSFIWFLFLATLGTDYKVARCVLGGFLVSNVICVIVLILFLVTCIEHVSPQFLSCLHCIITSRWLKLVACCFLLVKLSP